MNQTLYNSVLLSMTKGGLSIENNNKINALID